MAANLRDLAVFLEAAGKQASARGENQAAAAMFEAALMAMRLLEPEAALTLGKNLPKLVGMDADHREAISEGRTRHAMMRAARKAGYRTLGELCAGLLSDAKPPYKTSPSFLSQVMATKKKMPPDLATAIEKLTGYRWPQ